MKPILRADEVRKLEAKFFAANPGFDLMGVAADHVHAVAEARLADTPGGVLVVVGPGNNGGDGLFAAARLAGRHTVRLWTLGDVHVAALAAALSAGCQQVSAPHLDGVSLVIDAVAGIGGRPGLGLEVARFAADCAARGVEVLAVDLPSGLQADRPVLTESFKATTTLTFIAQKLCHVASATRGRCGEVIVADIGVSPSASLWQAEPADVWQLWPFPAVDASKYSRGVVGLDTGSLTYPGAGVLGVLGATHSGAGMVRYLGPAGAAVMAACPSSVSVWGTVAAGVVGSGWGKADPKRLAPWLEADVALVLDAEALVELPRLRPGCLLTPHPGELARLIEVNRAEVEADPISHALAAAERFDATVLLKGALQVVASPDGTAVLPVAGLAWAAQAGSGDVLAGICGALLAAGLDAAQAGVVGASVQALASLANPGPYPPDELARRLPKLIGEAATR